eukprot:637382-Rhodomonas_salina.1
MVWELRFGWHCVHQALAPSLPLAVSHPGPGPAVSRACPELRLSWNDAGPELELEATIGGP